MLIGAVLVDFDGTASSVDVSERLLQAFGQPGWEELDRAVDRGEIGLRQATEQQAAMLRGELGEMLRHVLERFEVDPAFPGFVAWADAAGLPLAVVSDGFGFYVRPMLEMAGLGHVEVRTNELDLSGPRPRLRHRFSHPICRGCGTCKMLADVEFRERFGPVAFVGDGRSDRYGALYADLVFAKDDLARVCRRDGVPFVPWSTFDDVLRELEAAENLPGPTAPDPCPGWRS